mmetsp:Transcript_47417/g.101500  ORF Transcript_47417/g.101500 Transcript_47417/m.101500 type:complete len:101 (+) Transcript_47417:2225-2527(+)
MERRPEYWGTQWQTKRGNVMKHHLKNAETSQSAKRTGAQEGRSDGRQGPMLAHPRCKTEGATQQELPQGSTSSAPVELQRQGKEQQRRRRWSSRLESSQA